MACTAGVQQYPASCSRMRHAQVIISVDAHSGRYLGVRAQAHLHLPAIFPLLRQAVLLLSEWRR